MDNPFRFIIPVQRKTNDPLFMLSPETLEIYKKWAEDVGAGEVPPKEISERIKALISAVESFRNQLIKDISNLVTVPEAAKICGLSTSAIYMAHHKGKLPEGCLVATKNRKGYKVDLALLYEYLQKSACRPR